MNVEAVTRGAVDKQALIGHLQLPVSDASSKTSSDASSNTTSAVSSKAGRPCTVLPNTE